MSCNHCAASSAGLAAQNGARDIEANWSAHREHPQYCPTCHAFVRADGGCSRCLGVRSDAETLALVAAPAAKPVYLSCGHQTVGAIGAQVWCTECDDWAIAGKAGTKKFSLFRSPLTGVDLAGADLTDLNLTGADLTNANLSGARLDRANLLKTTAPGATFTGITAKGLNLQKARLPQTDFSGANLHWAKFDDADLTGTVFNKASLRRCYFDRATLSGANLVDADLAGAFLRGADLSKANLSGANLTGAKYNDQTVWPDGFIPPAEAERNIE